MASPVIFGKSPSYLTSPRHIWQVPVIFDESPSYCRVPSYWRVPSYLASPIIFCECRHILRVSSCFASVVILASVVIFCECRHIGKCRHILRVSSYWQVSSYLANPRHIWRIPVIFGGATSTGRVPSICDFCQKRCHMPHAINHVRMVGLGFTTYSCMHTVPIIIPTQPNTTQRCFG